MYLLLWPELFLQDRMSWVGCLWEREGWKGWMEGWEEASKESQVVTGCSLFVGAREERIEGGEEVSPPPSVEEATGPPGYGRLESR